MYKFLLAAIAAVTLCGSAASAKTYRITDILDGRIGSFGYSVFHAQTNSRMSGSELEDPGTINPGGTWNATTGAIQFSFDLVGGGSVSAVGNMALGGVYGNSNQYRAVGGTIAMTFSGATNIWNGTHEFTFTPGSQMGSNLAANGVFNPSFTQMNLWGDKGNYGSCSNGLNRGQCVGVDLGLALAPVPIPAAGFLLIGALGGLVAMRRRKDAAA
ncbi:MAG: VPLPA-CTERM sorting domain-containing protein [Pseudomonadota bacterium]